MSAINPVTTTGTIPLLNVPKTNDPGEGQSFGGMVSDAIDGLNNTLNKADTLTMQAATGQLTDIHNLTIATNEAALATQLTVAVRNKALEAFDEIMRMPV
jgi:flagellar hook-basal body complex protein FliE